MRFSSGGGAGGGCGRFAEGSGDEGIAGALPRPSSSSAASGWLPDEERGVELIVLFLAAYLAENASPETALRFYDAASVTFARLADMPGIGERWPSANPRLAGLRVWRIAGFENHLFLYRPVDDGIEVVRIIHAARDIDSALLRSSSPRASA